MDCSLVFVRDQSPPTFTLHSELTLVLLDLILKECHRKLLMIWVIVSLPPHLHLLISTLRSYHMDLPHFYVHPLLQSIPQFKTNFCEALRPCSVNLRLFYHQLLLQTNFHQIQADRIFSLIWENCFLWEVVVLQLVIGWASAGKVSRKSANIWSSGNQTCAVCLTV